MYIIIHGTEGFVGKERKKFSELHGDSGSKKAEARDGIRMLSAFG